MLRDARYLLDIDPAEIDESAYPVGSSPSQVAVFLAEQKCRVVAARHPEDVVLAADTVVAFGETVLGKPMNAEHAAHMLDLLSGTTHLVITGVCVGRNATHFFKCMRVMSAVRMRHLTPGEIQRYVDSKLWEGKAGGYGIQDDDPFVIRQAGSKTNIVGLPMAATKQLLAEAGVTPGP